MRWNDEISNAHYLIISGNFNSKENGKLEFSFESIPYDKETELKESTEAHNIDPGYDELIKRGYYPGLPSVMKKFTEDGYKLFNRNKEE